MFTCTYLYLIINYLILYINIDCACAYLYLEINNTLNTSSTTIYLYLANHMFFPQAVTRRSRQSTSAQWSRSFRGGAPPHDDVDVDDVFFTPPTSATPLQHHDEADNVDGSKG